MALLGADFNENQPSDSDLVKRGAAVMRDIKARLKAFASPLFNTETGDFKDNIIRSTALKDLNPDPSGTFTKVTVNSKGLVTAGENPDQTVSIRLHRWVYKFESGTKSDGTAIAQTLATDTDGNTIAQYSFVFPAGISRIFVKVLAAGGGSKAAQVTGGGGGAYCEAAIDGSEGDVWLVWVGQGVAEGLGTPFKHSGDSKFEFNTFKYLRCQGGHAASASAQGGTPDAVGLAGAIALYGGNAIGAEGGSAGNGWPANAGSSNYGTGSEAAGGGGDKPGTNGLVIVEYFAS